MRRGATLLELALLLALLGLLALVALPSLARARDARLAHLWAMELALRHGEARLAALARARTALLDVSGDSVTLRLAGAHDTLRAAWWPGPAHDGLTLEPAERRLVFGTHGLPLGAHNVTLVLRRGGAERRVVISRAGRVRIE